MGAGKILLHPSGISVVSRTYVKFVLVSREKHAEGLTPSSQRLIQSNTSTQNRSAPERGFLSAVGDAGYDVTSGDAARM